jgi:3-oxoacyl-[acyl-carrier protein] reductase
MIDPGLKEQVVLVTGANSPWGIGAATARAFAAQGASVFLHYLRQSSEDFGDIDVDAPSADTPGMAFYLSLQAETADNVVQGIRQQGGLADSWEADLSDASVVPELLDRAERSLGPITVLVNNAAAYEADTLTPQLTGDGASGLWEGGPVTSSVNAGSVDRHFAVNTRAVALLMAEFARRRSQHDCRSGRIINVSADCSRGSPGEVSYRASKHALESYSRSAAAELGPMGITVNVVSPGPVQTGYMSPDLEEQLCNDIPLRRVGQPEDIADVVVFLASEQARWVTGQVLTVHGGHRMSLGI